MKAMISQPMAGKTAEEIDETREAAIEELKKRGYEVQNTCYNDDWCEDMEKTHKDADRLALCLLARSLFDMSRCDAVYFCKGWDNTRGCRIEYFAALSYNLDILYES